MRRGSSTINFLGVLTLLLAATAALADDWLPLDPAELKMTSEPLAPTAPAIYLYRQVDRDDSNYVEYIYNRIKILTEEGRASRLGFELDCKRCEEESLSENSPNG